MSDWSLQSGGDGGGSAGPEPAGGAVPRVTAVVVTWNRVATVRRLLGDLPVQRAVLDGRCVLDVVVVDNASEDGTAQTLHEEHPASRRVDNRAASGRGAVFTRAMGHLYAMPEPDEPGLTIVRNRRNLGGSGGFNTGLAWVYAQAERPEFVWLIDDDARLPEDALDEMLSVMTADRTVGLVGSRTVDIGDRVSPVESTIYFDRSTGFMRDRPPPGHAMHGAHLGWESAPDRAPAGVEVDRFSGSIDVDVVSACSMLCRWEAAEAVGPWDESFFLYCDDADWCLRVRSAGWRVVCCLGARVFHAPWHTKLTPVRDYYAKRNAVWMHRHALGGLELRRLSIRWPVWLAKESVRQWRAGRRMNAWMTARAMLDATLDRGGPLPDRGRGTEPSKLSFLGMLVVSFGLAAAAAPWVRARRVPAWAGRGGTGSSGGTGSGGGAS
ncbi:MAG: glycosyltransferase family 2 protein [Planctomycetota bacterium]